MAGLSNGSGNEDKMKRNREGSECSDGSTQTFSFFLNDEEVDESSITDQLQTSPNKTCAIDMNSNHITRKCRCEDAVYYRSDTVQRNWRIVSFLLGLLVLLMLFAFFWEFNEIRRIKRDLDLPKAEKFTQGRRSIPTHVPAAILRGNGNTERVQKGFSILNWDIKHQKGDIEVIEKKKIRIQKAGLYSVHAQMFFFENELLYNKNHTKELVLDFGVTNLQTNDRILAASVPWSSCKAACTRYISSMVELKKDAVLSVDTWTNDVKFKMLKDKASFGAYWIDEAFS